MKTVFTFISFICAVSLAGIGCEDYNNLALFAGLVFAVITVLIVLSNAKNDIETSKK